MKAAVTLVAFVVLSALALPWFQPGLPRDYALAVEFPPGRPGVSEPLLTAGEPGAADFLFVTYQSETHATLGYQRVGGSPVPPLTSPAFELRPGTRRRLVVDVPAFSRTRGGSRGGPDTLTVRLDDQPLLSAPVPFHVRKASRLFFAENPLPGSPAAPGFTGTLHAPDGRLLLGNARRAFTLRDRLLGWFADGWPQVACVALASLALGVFGSRMRRAFARIPAAAARHPGFLLALALNTTLFTWILTGYSGRVWYEESFGSFYDYQAAALLHGRLDVPEPAVGPEAFVARGRYYGYFGLTPALLRLPFAAFDFGFGWLSRSFMLAGFVAAQLAAYFILLTVRRTAAPRVPPAAPSPPSPPAAPLAFLFTLCAGAGSTLLFLASRAYIYHEANLTGAAFALAAAGCALRHVSSPASRWWLASLACGLLSLHARPPTGLFALVLLACAALVVVLRRFLLPSWRRTSSRAAFRLSLALPVLCFASVLSFNAVSYLKFRTFDGAPLKYHVQYHPERLARIAGSNFHLSNLPYNASTYLWRPFEVRRTFPWFYITGRNPNAFPRTKSDLAEPTVALPFAMPALTLLALVGAPLAARRHPPLRLPLLATALAVLPMAAALLAAVAVSQRYTTDFVPWLVTLAAFGFVALETAGPRLRRWLLALLVPLAALSVYLNAVTALHYQGTGVWGVPDEVPPRYRALRKSVDSFFGVRNPELYP